MKKIDGTRLIRRKPFKRKSERKLSHRDIAVLDFLWTWKVASTPMLREVAFRDKSQWWVYKALRQLKSEHYIQALPRGKFIEQELWALTALGFEVVLMDRDDLGSYRYKPHAPTHDYLATCLQLGPQSFSQTQDRQYFTEQMLASLTPANFPRAFRKVESHVPDGLTVYRNGVREAIVGYEVDLNLKDEERYRSTLDYYTEGVSAHLVVWLVKNPWVAERIIASLSNGYNSEKVKTLLSRTAFVGLDDFKTRIWDAESFSGGLKGNSVSKLHANLWQSIGKSRENSRQNDLKSLFFPKYKSPQKSLACTKVRKLVHRVEIMKDGYEIFFYIGQGHYERERRNESLPQTPLLAQEGAINEKGGLATARPPSKPLDRFFLDRCSKRLDNGGGDRD